MCVEHLLDNPLAVLMVTDVALMHTRAGCSAAKFSAASVFDEYPAATFTPPGVEPLADGPPDSPNSKGDQRHLKSHVTHD